ncbi:hypothetical protein HGA64_01345 [Candidatus Falkowbacteria bacterium]|nr:hypothetical protein [Candidatus Falkowbacteria bacterium]
MSEDLSNKSPLEKARVDQYHDLEGLSINKLQFGLWLTENKLKLLKGFSVFLIMVSIITWGYTFYSFGYYFIVGADQDNALAAQIVQSGTINHSAVLSVSAQNLRQGGTLILDSQNGKYDLVASIENPNPRFWASFDYYFVVDSTTTEKLKGFILPGESKKLLMLGREFSGRPNTAQLVFSDFVWARVNKKAIPDWTKYKNSLLNIEVADKKFVSARQSGLSDKISLSQLAFTVANHSSFNYLKANFDVLLYAGPNLIGADQFSLDSLQSGETRGVTANFLGQFNRVDTIEVVPNINILDPGNFLKFNSTETLHELPKAY